jgi:uncharacterized membrane protein YhaH (DUF805 family)
MGIAQLLFGFNGRIRRTSYWLGALGSGFALGIIFMILFFVLGGATILAANASGATAGADGTSDAGTAVGVGAGIVISLLILVYVALMTWISLALQIKRWHDRDKSGVWVLIGFIPLVGGIWALIECGFMDGTMGPNRYGPSPKGVAGPPPMQPGVMTPPVQPVAPPPTI